MKTKIFTLLFAIMASVGTIFAQSGTCGENLTWNLTNGVLTISGTGEMTKWSLASNVPWYSYRSRITSVIIGNSVTSIESYAFYNCSRLTNVTVPNSVTNIGGAAFSGCSGLTSIIVENGNSVYDSRNNCNAIIRTATNTLVAGCQNTTIPNSVTNIGNNAFSDCTSLTSITIPNSVTYINYNAFIGCSGLTSIEIPNSVIRIDDYAFYECSALTSITCEAITPPYCENHVFYEVNKSIPLYVPAQSVSAYQTATGWRDFANILPIQTIHYSSIADLYNMAADSTFTLGAFDVVYVPDFQNGSNMYIKDETGSMVIYKPNYGLQAGDHVEAGLQGKINIYNGLHEITPVSAKDNLTITAGEAPAPIEATEVPSATNVNQYVVYKNVSFATDTAFVSSKRHAVQSTWNNQEITFYNQYYIGATLSANKTYNITAVNTIYRTILQAYPLAVEEVTTETPDTCVIASGTCGENITWTLSCDSVLTISGTGDMTDWEDTYYTPWYNIRFSVKQIVIEDGVTSIGKWALANCINVSSATIPNGVTRIGNYAFYKCIGLTSATIGNSVTSIGYGAFRACENLTSVTIGNSVTNIGDYAFQYCPSLTVIAIPNSVTSIGAAAFFNCFGLTSVTIGNNVTSIGGGAFLNCSRLTSIIIPNSVTSIGGDAFQYCYGLTSLEIPNSVTNIGVGAFSGCKNLTSIVVEKDNAIYDSRNNCNAIIETATNTLISGCQNTIIPNSVTSIGDYAFYDCEDLTSITIPNSVTSIGESAFRVCYGLTSIEIPNSVTSIGDYAFCGCYGLTSIEIPNSVTNIGEYAFQYCSGLTSITCNAVTPPTCGNNVFIEVDKSIPLYVPAGSIAAYQAANGWSEFTNILPIEGEEPCVVASGTCGNNLTWTLTCDSVLTISGTGDMTDWQDTYYTPWYDIRFSVKQIVIEDGVTGIGKWAFGNCVNVSSVTIPNGVTRIADWAFGGCQMETLEIPNSVLSIGKYAFYTCESLKNLTLSGNLLSIGQYAFCYCHNLTSIELPNKLTTLDEGAFRYCSGLSSVTIPNSVTSIGIRVFGSCSGLNSIIVASNNSNYSSEDGVLFNKNKTTLLQFPGAKIGSYTIPQGVINIAQEAFMGSSLLLTSIVIPSSVASIGERAFYDCVYFASITCEAVTPPTCGDEVFYEVDKSVCTLYVPAQSITAYQTADVWKEFGNILPIEGSEEPGNLCDAPTELRVANMYNNNAGTVSLSWNGTAASYEVKAYSYELDQWYGPKIVNGTQTSFNNMPIGLTDFYVRAICGENEYSSEAIATKLLYYSDLMAVDYLDLDNAICYVNNSTPTDTRTFNDFRQVPAVNYGPSDINSRHTIHYDRNETDLRTGGMAKTVPDGELASVRLGNWDSGAQAERIEFSFTIDTLTSPVLLLKYLPIFEAPEHDASANPRIKVDLLINGQSLGRGYQLDINANDVYTGSQLKPSAWADGWHITSASVAQTAGDIVWKEWTTVGFNLRSPMYQGRTITVRITTFDCTFSAHCGYVYFTIRGSNGQFKGMKCGQINPELEAPDGFNYRWMYASNEQYRRPNGSVPEQYILSRDQIYNAGMQDDSLYVVDCMFAQDSSRFFSLYATPLAAEPIAQMNEPQIARNEQDGSYTVLFDASLSQVQEIDHVIGDTLVSRNSNIDSYEWNIAGIPNGWSDEVSPTFTFPGDGTYKVTLRVTSGGCESMLHYNLQLQPETPEPCLIASGTCGANLTWELSCDSVLTISGTGAMVDNPSWSPYVSLIKAVIMPEGLTIIGRNAFAECVNLESAHIPESVTAIGPAAFYNCSALTSINMPDSVRMLGHKAFVGCESLTEPVYNAHIFGFMPRNYCGAYSIPEGIVSVAAYAFCGIASATCSGLTEITIPSSVKRLGVEAFGLLFLRKITCLAVTPPTCDSTTFEWYLEETGITVKVDRSIPVYVPAESVDAYKAADVWKEFFNILPIGGTIEPQDSIYDVVYLDQEGLQLDYEPVTLHLPEAPQIEGFTFLKWQIVAGDLENGIHIQAVYTADEPTNAPEVYTNPANKAQKLIRNGKVYILTDDKVYSISGQKVK